MLFLAVLPLISHLQDMNSKYNGVWASDEGVPLVLFAEGFHTKIGDDLFEGAPPHFGRNGDFHGFWNSAPQPPFVLSAVDTKTANPAAPIPKGAPLFTDIVPDGPLHRGDIDLVPLDDGSLRTTITDSKSNLCFGGNMQFVGKSSWIIVSGHYASKSIDLNIAEGRGAVRAISGSLGVGGERYSLNGVMTWDRGTFILKTLDGDIPCGYGWVVWDPTKSYIKAMPFAEASPSDRIELHVQETVKGPFVNGVTEELLWSRT